MTWPARAISDRFRPECAVSVTLSDIHSVVTLTCVQSSHAVIANAPQAATVEHVAVTTSSMAQATSEPLAFTAKCASAARCTALASDDGKRCMQKLVVKKAVEFGEAEVYMNERLMRTAPSAIAQFVTAYSEGPAKQGSPLVLVWKFEGKETLDSVLRARDFPLNVEPMLLGRELRIEDPVERRLATIKVRAAGAALPLALPCRSVSESGTCCCVLPDLLPPLSSDSTVVDTKPRTARCEVSPLCTVFRCHGVPACHRRRARCWHCVDAGL